MANKLYQDTAVQDIADAIREKNGEPATTKYKIAEMGPAIRALPTGGEKPVVTDFRYLFAYGRSRDLIGKVILQNTQANGSNMFYYNATVTEADVLSVLNDPDNSIAFGVSLANMFNGCISISSFDLSNINFTQQTPTEKTGNTVSSMFATCKGLYNLNVRTKEGQDELYLYNPNYFCLNCTSLETVNFENVELNGVNFSSMFRGCSNLQGKVKLKLKFRSGATPTSGALNQMFEGCTKLGTVDLDWRWETAKNMTSSRLFYNCTSLKNIVMRNDQAVCPMIDSECFYGVPANCKIYVPDSLVNSYKTATNWSTRAAYIFPLSEYVES